jgi:hypothetical protein
LQLRYAYLFRLAALCHVPPGAVGGLKLTEFAILIDGIDQAGR